MMLAGGAVAISTALVDDMGFFAVLTLIDGNACCWCSALDDGLHGFAVLIGHVGSETMEVLWSEGTEDVIYGCHSQTPAWCC